MATHNLFSQLRRRSSHISSLRSLIIGHYSAPPLSRTPLLTHRHQSLWCGHSIPALYSRSFSTRSLNQSEFVDERLALPENVDVGFSELTEVLVVDSGQKLSTPVCNLIAMLDQYHELSGFPWWVIIASSTLAMRVTLLPILLLQLQRTKEIAKFYPKLPSLLPPPLSGRSYFDQIIIFRKERRSMGCPSFLWVVAYSFFQVPCFFLWMDSIRQMSLDHHPGFECGGALWFENLTAVCHNTSCLIFPFIIAFLHYINVMISFAGSSVGKVTDLLGLLAKIYKIYLDILTIPIFFIACCIPQGSLIYWLTNSSLSVIQQLCLKHPAVRAKLGLPDKVAQATAANSEPATTFLDSPTGQYEDFTHTLSPKELLTLSVQLLSEGNNEKAIPLLQLALDKDPEYARALTIMGQTLMQNRQETEAIAYFERAILKLSLAGQPTEVEETDLLILAAQWAGVAYIRQGKVTEGLVHLEKIAHLKEPEEPMSKEHYFEGLVLLSSALFREGRKDEAANYLRLAAAYNSAYNEFLEQIEKAEDAFDTDLVGSRRCDY